MKSPTIPRSIFLACLVLSGAGGKVWAQQAEEPGQVRESVRRVERETGGRVLRIESIQRNGQDVYRMKVLTPGGRIRVMQERPGGRVSPRPAQPRPMLRDNQKPSPPPPTERSVGARPHDGT
ncbi:MAG: hypothetical protein R3F04_04875 [Lysobacteraceae bacterium]